MAQNMIKLIFLKNVSKHFNFYFKIRSYSTIRDVKENGIKKSVFISQSNNVYTNLAMEDWLYKNFNFSNHHILMLWQNDPCVVIGRHQNPWLEVNTSKLTEQKLQLARRNSGGGTVYHDLGNLNMTFFTPRDRYNRKYNLELITRALFRKFELHLNITEREDLIVRDHYKQISGSAAKLGRPNAYHHCTLLVDVNKPKLSQALQKRQTSIVTNATKSISSPVMNLLEENPNLSVQSVMEAIGWEYLRTDPVMMHDEGQDFMNTQRGFQLVNPTEQWFPGLTQLRGHLVSWEWCFGKTPKFNISKSFPVPAHFLPNVSPAPVNGQELKITMEVYQGHVEEVSLNVPPGLSASGLYGDVDIITSLKGCKFTEEAICTLEHSLIGADNMLSTDKRRFVTDCVRQVMTSM